MAAPGAGGGAAWITTFRRFSNDSCQAYDVDVGSDDTVYVSARNGSYNGGSVLKLDAEDGSILAVNTYQKNIQNIQPFAISVDRSNSDNVYVAGYWDDGGAADEDGMVLKMNSSLTLQWNKLHSASSQRFRWYALDVDSSGNAYVGGQYNTQYPIYAKYNSSGTIQYDYGALGAWSSNGSIYGVKKTSSGPQIYVGQADGFADGWTFTVNDNYSASNQKVYEPNTGQLTVRHVKDIKQYGSNYYISGVGNISGTYGSFVSKLNTSMNDVWTRTLTTSTTDFAAGARIALDSSGNVYLGWNRQSGGNIYASISKFDSSGTHQWTNEFEHANGHNSNTAQAVLYGVTVDSTDQPIIVGRTYDDFNANTYTLSAFVAKIPADGSGTGSYGNYFTYSSVSSPTISSITLNEGAVNKTVTDFGGFTSVTEDTTNDFTDVVSEQTEAI